MTPSQALLREFSTQYLVGEMPRFTPDFVETVLPSWAKTSALRLSGQVDDTHELIELLDELRQNRGHPLLADLEDATSIDWLEQWPVFSRLMELLVSSLRQISLSENTAVP